MNFAYWMIVVAMFLPYAAVVLAKSGGVDNHAPRTTLAALTGWRQRANWRNAIISRLSRRSLRR